VGSKCLIKYIPCHSCCSSISAAAAAPPLPQARTGSSGRHVVRAVCRAMFLQLVLDMMV
jgi:hypothetical protein